jgi:hypothetical protein
VETYHWSFINVGADCGPTERCPHGLVGRPNPSGAGN